MFKMYNLLFALVISMPLCSQPGMFDTSYGKDGISNSIDYDVRGRIGGIAVQPDNKIIAVGHSIDNNILVARYNTQGWPDSSFGINGFADTSVDSVYQSNWAQSVKIQQDGKIVVAVYSDHITRRSDFNVWRYNADGSFDHTFGKDGRVSTNINRGDYPVDILIQKDGKIIMVGNTFADAELGNRHAFVLIRYKRNGSIDTSFGSNGILTVVKDYKLYSSCAALAKDDKIIVAGTAINNYRDDNRNGFIARFTVDGHTDSSFATDGFMIKGERQNSEDIKALTISSGNRIVAFSEIFIAKTGLFVTAVARYNIDGTLDATFGKKGIVQTSPGSPYSSYVGDIAVQNDDKIIVSGNTGVFFNPSLTVGKILPNGIIDSSFGEKGYTTLPGKKHSSAYALAIQSDGKIIAAGYIGDYAFVERLLLTRLFGGDMTANYTKHVSGASATAKSTIKVYPNPATNFITVTGLSPATKPVIRIIDNNGTICKELPVKNSTCTIPVNHLKAGAYYVQVLEGNTYAKFTFIKQ